MLFLAELKCIACRRVCGEIVAETEAQLRAKIKAPLPLRPDIGARCTVEQRLGLRCRRCGGYVFLEVPDRVYPDELGTSLAA
ncbi:MAG: hypothetical protein HY685_00910 [Chloroflexi bacterium]|nr:hypothetical protein [Chloroflexota bacterium]